MAARAKDTMARAGVRGQVHHDTVLLDDVLAQIGGGWASRGRVPRQSECEIGACHRSRSRTCRPKAAARTLALLRATVALGRPVEVLTPVVVSPLTGRGGMPAERNTLVLQYALHRRGSDTESLTSFGVDALVSLCSRAISR